MSVPSDSAGNAETKLTIIGKTFDLAALWPLTRTFRERFGLAFNDAVRGKAKANLEARADDLLA